MDIRKLQKLNDYCWTLSDQSHPIELYGSQKLILAMDDKVLEQIINVSQLPGLVGNAMTMPDAHWGYGFPIGGVAAFDAEQGGIISAGGVGFDISCGIRCLRTNLTLADIQGCKLEIADALFKNVPAGVGVGGKFQLSSNELINVMLNGARWAVKLGYGEQDDLHYIEEQGCMAGAQPDYVSNTAIQRQLNEMGTLGSGNHYLEIQLVEKIFEPAIASAFGIYEGQLLISIHCGSRGFGHQIGTDYLIKLAKAANRLGLTLVDRELACAPINSPEGQEYFAAMCCGINCALANRQVITHLVRETFAAIIPAAAIETLYDVSHNTCKIESHLVAGKNRKLHIHRKGATRAFGPGHPDLPKRYRDVGQPVIIGGSMGTGSYILVGNNPEKNKAFASASHGAGRAMSRHQALKKWRGPQLINQLNVQGILIRSLSMRGIAEEAPGAYKDVDAVAIATENSGLARRVALLRPVICVKG